MQSLFHGSLIEWLRHVTPYGVKACFWALRSIYVEPWFWVSMIAIFALERLAPVVGRQRTISKGVIEDFVWLNLQAIFTFAVIKSVVTLCQQLYISLTGGRGVLTAVNSWPVLLKVMAVLVVGDLFVWIHHWIRHRGMLWHFHAVHHSQRELNQFTDLRFHFVDQLMAYAITAVPLFALQMGSSGIMAVGLVLTVHGRFIHANIRTNLGPLRHVFVSPQFHRIHHSIEPEHQEKNFGGLLTCWDRMFGTLYPHYDEYPATGVAGIEFAPVTGPRSLRGVSAIWQQVAYPFRQIAARARIAAAPGARGSGAPGSED